MSDKYLNPQNSQDIVVVNNLVNRFGSHTVHDGLNFKITHKEIIGVVGGSGTGKSVLMRSILGLHDFTSGQVYFKGKNIKSLSHNEFMELQQSSGVLFQSGALFSGLSVLDNVAMPILEHNNISRSQAYELAKMKIELVGLPAVALHRLPSALSGGMIKRAALARALALDPDILFLDEPTAGLDPISAAEFDSLLRDLTDALGFGVMMITHDLDSLYSICDTIAVLVDKKIIIDKLENLRDNPHPWIHDYFHGKRSRNVMETM